jgi:Protein of unknown function (DUF3618)
MSSLESDLERTRDQLAATIDELMHRVSPKTIVDRQVSTTKAHFVDTDSGKPRADNIGKVAAAVVGFIVVLAIIRKVTR